MARLSRLCGCGRIVSGRCDTCDNIKAASAEDYRPGKAQRYGTQWAALSKRYRIKNPLCQKCLAEGRTTVAIEVHHKIKARLRPDLILKWNNLMSVCRACHIELDRE